MIKLGSFIFWLDCTRYNIEYGYFSDRPELVWAQCGDYQASGRTLCSVLEFVSGCLQDQQLLLDNKKP